MSSSESDEMADEAIKIANADLSWEGEAERRQHHFSSPLTLENVSLTVPTGKLIAVVGSVGAGKTNSVFAV